MGSCRSTRRWAAAGSTWQSRSSACSSAAHSTGSIRTAPRRSEAGLSRRRNAGMSPAAAATIRWRSNPSARRLWGMHAPTASSKPCNWSIRMPDPTAIDPLGDLRRRNGTSPSVLRPDLLEKLKARLLEPPPDGGLWTSPKVAAWMASELGLAAVLPQRGWEALKAIGWSVQKPRPRHPAGAPPEEREAFKKAGHGRCRGSGQAPGHAGRGLGHGRAPHWPEAD